MDDSRHPDWPYYGAAKQIVKLMEKLYHYGLGYRAFETWLKLCHLSLDAMPDVVSHVAQGGQLGDYRDAPEIHEQWEHLTHDMRLYGLSPSGIDPVDLLTLAQMQALPEPHKTLYENVVADASPGRDHWVEQVNRGRASQLNLFGEEV